MLKYRFSTLLCSTALICILPGAVEAAGAGAGGQDVLHVPLAWCPVTGSPAEANPNLAGDTNTDAILWRRHERPTDNIYLNPNQTDMTFRSAINNAWDVLDFPEIADPDTTQAQPGDMRGEDVNAFGAEFNAMINNCDAAWAGAPLNRANIGVTAVNAGLFHDMNADYVGVIGWGGCTRSLASPNVCATPHDGRIAVIDNIYLHPASPDRTFPPSPMDPGGNLQFVITDPLDQLVGHELGHALGLDHRNNTAAMMNPGQQDQDGDGQTDNVDINATETGNLRASGLIVPGLEIDPPLRILPGEFAAVRAVDRVGEFNGRQTPLDIASVRVVHDKWRKQVYFAVQLYGLVDAEDGEALTYWTLVDADPGQEATPDNLRRAGLPEAEFGGADLILRVDVRGRQVEGRAFVVRDGQLVDFPRVFTDLQRLVMHPHTSPLPGREPIRIGDAAIYDVVVASLPRDLTGLFVDRPFRLQSLVVRGDQEVVDRLEDERRDRGRSLVVQDPSFPHCFVLEPGRPGEAVDTSFEGLVARQPVHALVGPREVARAEADARGGGELELPIPRDAEPGLHLVTIGTDDTALTADCVVRVLGPDGEQPSRRAADPRLFELLERQGELLREQQLLLRQFGDTVGGMTERVKP